MLLFLILLCITVVIVILVTTQTSKTASLPYSFQLTLAPLSTVCSGTGQSILAYSSSETISTGIQLFADEKGLNPLQNTSAGSWYYYESAGRFQVTDGAGTVDAPVACI